MHTIRRQTRCESGQIQIWVGTDDIDFESWCDMYRGSITILDQFATKIDPSHHLHWYSVIVADELTAELFMLKWS
jgi:hypothetical protein